MNLQYQNIMVVVNISIYICMENVQTPPEAPRIRVLYGDGKTPDK